MLILKLAVVTLIGFCITPALSMAQSQPTSQACDEMNSASVSQAVNYLGHANHNGNDTHAAVCIKLAFSKIAALPVSQSTPLLIEYLGYKRPKTESEEEGFYMHAPGPTYFYPAVDSLYKVGSAAEPALLDFLAHDGSASAIERKNAVYTLLLIRHGNTLSLIQTLSQKKAATSDAAVRARLSAAAEEVVQWCLPEYKQKCQAAASR